jgi:steroid delta-isomerase-like uncharacterized protein
MPETKTEAAAAKPRKPRRSAKSREVEKTARELFEAVGAHDVDGILRVWAEDGVEDIAPVGVFRGKKEIEGFARDFLGASSDLEVTVGRVIADDSRAVVEWRFQGTFDGPFQGIEPNGKPFEMRGNDILEIEDGKVHRLTAYYDAMEFARKIGMMPAQDTGPERAMKSAFNAVTKVRRAVEERRG